MKSHDSYNFVQTTYNDGTIDIKNFKHGVKFGHEKPISNFVGERTEEQEAKSKNSSISRSRQTFWQLIRNNTYDLFLTITFSPEVCDRYNEDEVNKALKNKVLKPINRKDKNWKSARVPEYHKDGALHMHMLCTNSPAFDIYEVNEKDSSGRQMYTSDLFEKLGRCRITKIERDKDSQDSAKKYATKYITKDSVERGKHQKRYITTGKHDKPLQSKIMLSDEQKNSVISYLEESNEVQFSKTIPIPQTNNTLEILNLSPKL